MERIVLHSDMNNFYASVECLDRPHLKDVPMVVGGDIEARHGIVLAKNEIAKKYGIKTAIPLWQAKRLCENIVVVPPNFEKYTQFSAMAKEIYTQYTDLIEPFGIDECWLDVTGSVGLFGDGKTIADSIRNRIKKELGLTVSVGVSFNKIFAKLGSDMKKPDATTVISSSDYKEKLWNLPVGRLLYVGKATEKKLERFYISTIGELATSEKSFLEKSLGKMGITLWEYANGLDNSTVACIEDDDVVKSIGNGTTMPRDIVTFDEARIVLHALAESVSTRLREKDFICDTIQLGIRDSNLKWITRQGKLDFPNRTVKSVYDKACGLLQENHKFPNPIRSLSIQATGLEHESCVQLSFMDNAEEIRKEEILDTTIDKLRDKYGAEILQRGISLKDKTLSDVNPHGGVVNPFPKM